MVPARPLAITGFRTRLRILATRCARAISRSSALEGVGNAGCEPHPQPRVGKMETTRVSHHGYSRNHPAFPHANGFNGFLRALPGDRAFLSPSPADHLRR